jgi:HAD superfamily hydrolase (TIGR01459 family)
MQPIDSILTVADRYDAIVFDQWGVLHNGSAPYPHAIHTIAQLIQLGKSLAVLSNSGKSAHVNSTRITNMGFAAGAFGAVMTSGEALKIDIAAGKLGAISTLYAITAKKGDAQDWAAGLPIRFADNLADADAVLLMGLPDGTHHKAERMALQDALSQNKTLICSNPDRTSPRADGKLVESPGALAHDYADVGGKVLYYGKPHRPVFDALSAQLSAAEPHRILMVGDSPEHDIAGAKEAGWHSLFIAGGIHAAQDDVASLFADIGLPEYSLPTLR